MDGVLIEAGESFPAMVRTTVEREWARAGFTADTPGYSPRHNEVLKKHGAFNDDYDIVWVLLNIAHSRLGSLPEEERKKGLLSSALPDPKSLGSIIASCGENCIEWVRRSFESADRIFERENIRRISMAVYFGDLETEGACMLEYPMLDVHWRDLPMPVYIYTGRDLREWRLAQKTLSWQDFPDERVVHYDTGMIKPSPSGLEHICRKFGHSSPLFFGDTMSDKKSQEAFGRGAFVLIGGLLQDEKHSYTDVSTALSELIGCDMR